MAFWGCHVLKCKVLLRDSTFLIPDKYNLPLMESTISERMPLSRCINQYVTVGDLQIPAPQSIIDYAEHQADAGVSAAEFEALALEVLAKIGVK